MMTILDAAAALIAEHPERALPRAGWPCCVWVEGVALEAAGLLLRDLPLGWQGLMRIYDATDPWSSCEAAWALVARVGPVTAPGFRVRPGAQAWTRLTPGRWHVVQRWTHLQPDGTAVGQTTGGHTVLLRYDGDGRGLLLESSEEDGVRLCGVPWHEGPPPDVETMDVRPWLAAGRAGIAAVPLWEGA